MNIAEFRRLAKPHKYGAKRVKVDGIGFDSLLEFRRYQQLKLLERAGEICELKVHPRYPLFAAVSCDAVLIGHCEFDFSYREVPEPGVCGPIVIEDAKGAWTALGRWKLNHFQTQYRVKVRIIKAVKTRKAV